MTTSSLYRAIEILESKFLCAQPNAPFEEFATTVMELALFDVQGQRNEFARLIFSTDWSAYKNERNGQVIGMNDVLKAGRKSERDHIEFVQTLPEPYGFANHDHSKDDFYILICCLRFRYPFNVENYKCFVKFCETTFQAHYKAESHHPEFEMFSKERECSLRDVEETAVDRMARNFQFSADGQGDADAMARFKPKWTKNSERNTQHYDLFVQTHYAKIGELWASFIKMR